MKNAAPFAILFAGLLCTSAFAQDAAPAAATTSAAAPAAEAPAAVASPAAADSPEAAPVAAPAATDADEALSANVTAAVGVPAPGKALVVFFRPSKFVGGAVGFIVREGEAELGKLRNGTYFAVQVEPGPHAYAVHSEAKDITNIEAEEGETYFLSGSVSMGVMVGRPNLSPSDAGAFEAVLTKLKPAKPLN